MAKRKLTLEIVNIKTSDVVRTHHFYFESDESNFLLLNIDGSYHKLNSEGMNFNTPYCRIIEVQSICDLPFLKDSCTGSFDGGSHKE